MRENLGRTETPAPRSSSKPLKTKIEEIREGHYTEEKKTAGQSSTRKDSIPKTMQQKAEPKKGTGNGKEGDVVAMRNLDSGQEKGKMRRWRRCRRDQKGSGIREGGVLEKKKRSVPVTEGTTVTVKQKERKASGGSRRSNR